MNRFVCNRFFFAKLIIPKKRRENHDAENFLSLYSNILVLEYSTLHHFRVPNHSSDKDQ
jgi:hypothetical protein